MVEIEVNGVRYPAYVTMGAMLRFAELAGKEVTAIEADSLTDLCKYLWCCVKSACAREHREFDLDLQTLCDSITPDVVGAWSAAIGEANSEKKAVTA